MTRAAALGFDVGTSAVKAGLLWLESDEPMVTVARAYPTLRPQPGWVEQDPREWVSAMAGCWADLQALEGDVELRSVGLCSQVNTHLFVDADLAPQRAAITWQDVRAAEVAAELGKDASFSLSRLAWLQRHEPALRAATRWLLLPKDYCLAELTGELATDPLSAVGLVGTDGTYLDDVLALVDGAAELLPPLRSFDQALGLTREANAVGLPSGVPVAVGAMDAWGSFFGAGLVHERRALDLAGTSEVVGVASSTSIAEPGIVSFPPLDGLHIHAGPTQAGGSALEWVARLIGQPVSEALALAAAAAVDPQPVVFLPHLAGERAPYWNPDARGVFLGLTDATDAGHLVLATLEGVAHAVRMLLEGCERAAGLQAERLRAAGGGARSSLWNQLKADATGLPIEVLDERDAGVLGAVFMGQVAAGLGPDVPSLAEERVRIAEVLEPYAPNERRLADLHVTYAESYQALEPLFPRLSAS
jgi:xylulokinase